MSELQDPRVFFSAERSLLSWNRTSLALITFGFFINRSGIMLPLVSEEQGEKEALFAWLGLAFIFIGSICSLYAVRQFRKVVASLGPSEIPPGYRMHWSTAPNILVGVLGFMVMVVLNL
jgi:Predicted membrane protein